MDCNNCNQNANCFNHNNMNMPRNGRYNRGNCNRMMSCGRPMPEQGCGCEMNNNVRERKMDNPNCGMERNTMNHSIGNDNHRCGSNMSTIWIPVCVLFHGKNGRMFMTLTRL